MCAGKLVKKIVKKWLKSRHLHLPEEPYTDNIYEREEENSDRLEDSNDCYFGDTSPSSKNKSNGNNKISNEDPNSNICHCYLLDPCKCSRKRSVDNAKKAGDKNQFFKMKNDNKSSFRAIIGKSNVLSSYRCSNKEFESSYICNNNRSSYLLPDIVACSKLKQSDRRRTDEKDGNIFRMIKHLNSSKPKNFCSHWCDPTSIEKENVDEGGMNNFSNELTNNLFSRSNLIVNNSRPALPLCVCEDCFSLLHSVVVVNSKHKNNNNGNYDIHYDDDDEGLNCQKCQSSMFFKDLDCPSKNASHSVIPDISDKINSNNNNKNNILCNIKNDNHNNNKNNDNIVNINFNNLNNYNNNYNYTLLSNYSKISDKSNLSCCCLSCTDCYRFSFNSNNKKKINGDIPNLRNGCEKSYRESNNWRSECKQFLKNNHQSKESKLSFKRTPQKNCCADIKLFPSALSSPFNHELSLNYPPSISLSKDGEEDYTSYQINLWLHNLSNSNKYVEVPPNRTICHVSR